MKNIWFFDLDGTLADTDPDIRLAWKAALSDLGLSCPSFDSEFVAGPALEDMARKLFPAIYTEELGRSIRERFAIRYDACGFPSTREYPGVRGLLSELKRGGARLAIVTNKRYEGAKAIAAKFGWMEFFEKIYAADMFAPAPRLDKTRLMAYAMDDMRVCAAECVMAGDTSNDFRAARTNGVMSIAAAWGYGRPDELAEADFIARTPAEVPLLAEQAAEGGVR